MNQQHAPAGARPRVTVLMATYNGREWIDAQIDSVLGQRGVDVRLVVSDDGSIDGTLDRLADRTRADFRIDVLPRRSGPPGVTANFLRLFTEHEPDGSYVAFCDQDDVWRADKLEHQIGTLVSHSADVVSSNVESFDLAGNRRLIKKSHPMGRWDHVFEAAGPGSTYVFTPEAHRRLRETLATLDYSEIGVHDWYVYALARAIGLTWVICPKPTVDYRQHEGNVQGANAGAAATAARVSKLRNGFYRRQFLLTARAIEAVNTYDEATRRDLHRLIDQLEDESFFGRLRFLSRWRQIRRNHVEGLELAGAHVLGVW
ncbi:glycosyltransferase [Actinomyces culturomici]|uniref:glycosyltransferase n=1 Tax=Actinomyces culturomici TaxID=1926276 RepID=UPI001F3A3A9B|nr:glycosyltransferase [Actinomyces culturomici]